MKIPLPSKQYIATILAVTFTKGFCIFIPNAIGLYAGARAAEGRCNDNKELCNTFKHTHNGTSMPDIIFPGLLLFDVFMDLYWTSSIVLLMYGAIRLTEKIDQCYQNGTYCFGFFKSDTETFRYFRLGESINSGFKKYLPNPFDALLVTFTAFFTLLAAIMITRGNSSVTKGLICDYDVYQMLKKNGHTSDQDDSTCTWVGTDIDKNDPVVHIANHVASVILATGTACSILSTALYTCGTYALLGYVKGKKMSAEESRQNNMRNNNHSTDGDGVPYEAYTL